jgi:AraC-like DNA-binding protein
MVTAELMRAVNERDLELRRLFAETLLDSEFQEEVRTDPEVFHSTLRLAQQRNWVHYSQLAKLVGLSDTHVNKMFKEEGSGSRFTPGVGDRLEVLTQLSKLLASDVERMRCGFAPVGHLTANELVRSSSTVDTDSCTTPVLQVMQLARG